MNEALVAGLVAVAIGLVEIVKASVKKFGKTESVLTEEERTWMRDLHDWHDKEDADGVKVWYIRQSLADAITTFATAVDSQTRALTAILTKLEVVDQKVDSLKDD